jgi:uncharacterized Fe-S radical SAM superfamily protein PflX
MKITVTVEEAKAIVSDRYNTVSSNVTIDTEEVPKPLTGIPITSLLEFAVNFPRVYNTEGVWTNKIQMIKELRSLAEKKGFYLGLWDAKTFCERAERFR